MVFRKEVTRRILKKNPLKNKRVMIRLNPYEKAKSKASAHLEAVRNRKKEELLNKKRGVGRKKKGFKKSSNLYFMITNLA